MAGRKTHEQQIREFERKPDYPREQDLHETNEEVLRNPPAKTPKEGVRQSEFPVSRQGMNQESRHRKPESDQSEEE